MTCQSFWHQEVCFSSLASLLKQLSCGDLPLQVLSGFAYTLNIIQRHIKSECLCEPLGEEHKSNNMADLIVCTFVKLLMFEIVTCKLMERLHCVIASSLSWMHLCWKPVVSQWYLNAFLNIYKYIIIYLYIYLHLYEYMYECICIYV
jgi:hypothetical protein